MIGDKFPNIVVTYRRHLSSISLTATAVTLLLVGRQRRVSVKNMKKQFKISLAATAVAVTVISTGLTSYAMAQERSRSGGGTFKKVAQGSGGSGTALANKTSLGDANDVIHLLDEAICQFQNSAIRRTDNQDHISLIIQACNRAVFAMSTPEQQKAREADIQIDRFAPNKSVWREIAKTPSVPKALLKVTDSQNKLAKERVEAIWAKIMHPSTQDIADSGLLGLSQSQKLAELSHASTSEAVQRHNRWMDSQYSKACSEMRASLTTEQKAEWDKIMKIYTSNLPKTTP